MRRTVRDAGEPRGVAVWLSAALLLTIAAPAGAMVVVQRDFPQLVGRAEQIVVGTVTDVRSQTDADGVPHTLVTFSELTVLKGDVGSTLTLQLYGGKNGDSEVRMAGMPSFAVGERDVLFVAGNGRDVCPLVGIWQGRFRVRYEAAQGTDLIEDGAGQPVTGLSGRELLRAPRRSAGAPPAPLTLDAFRQLIADELAHPQADTGAPQ